MKEYLELATLKEANNGGSESNMLQETVQDLKSLVEGLQTAANLAEQAGDDATNDLFVGQVGQLQKQLWLLSATLG